MAMRIAGLAVILALAVAGGSAEQAVAQSTTAPSRRPAATRPATSRPSKAESRRSSGRRAATLPPSVTAALQDLAKEYELGKLRQKADYFTGPPNPELTPLLVVQLLNRPLGESDSMDGYIKWQLLSAMPKDLPDDLAGMALDAYRNAPGLEQRPGMDPDQRRRLVRALVEADRPADIAAQLDNEIQRWNALNGSVTAYRDALFARLPDAAGVFEAALNDVYTRSMVGIDPRPLTEPLATRMIRWANQDANANEARQLAEMVKKLMAARIPEYYEGIIRILHEGGRYEWAFRRADPNRGKKLQDILTALQDSAGGEGDNRPRLGHRRGR